jgi:hypothetical protein
MLSLLFAGALAQAAPLPPADDPFVLSCDPARALQRIVRMVPAAALQANLETDSAAGVMMSALFTDPARARTLGLDPDGPFEMVMAGEGMRLRLPLEPAGPGALADHLGLEVGPDGSVDIPGGPPARFVDGALVADTLAQDLGTPPLLAGLPDTQGCRIHVPLVDKGMHVGALLPEDPTAPILLRLQTPLAPPAVLGAAPAAPVGGSSHATPFVVASLGVSPQALLEDPTVQAALAKASDQAMDFDALEDGGVTILPGTTLALFMAGDGPQGVAVIPVAGKRGKDIRVKRVTRGIARAAEQEGARVTKLGKAGLRIEGRKRAFTIAVQGDRVVIGTHTDATLHAAAGRGDPWVRPALEEMARTHALAVVMDTAAMFPGMKAVSLEAGLGATADAWQVVLRLDGDPEMMALFAESIRKGIAEGKSDKD